MAGDSRSPSPQRLSSHFATTSRRVQGTTATARLADILVRQSQWFEIMPYPDDEYEITVKAEAGRQLDALLRPPLSRTYR